MGGASRTISARSGAVNWKMGKLTMDQAVAVQAGMRMLESDH